MAGSLTLERIFDVPAERVWAAWIDPEVFKEWYGGAGATLGEVKMEVKQGSSWTATLYMPNRLDVCLKGDYREVTEPDGRGHTPGRLVYALRNPANWRDPNVEVVSVDFKSLGNHTLLVLNQTGGLPKEDYETRLNTAWTSALDKLELMLGGLSDRGPA